MTEEPSAQEKFNWEIVVVVATAAVLIFLIVLPNFVRARTSTGRALVNDLRLIQGAKEQWAIENHATNGTEVALKDIAAYIKTPPWENPVAKERYVMNPIGTSPEIQFTKRYQNFEEGVVLRFAQDYQDFEILLPTGKIVLLSEYWNNPVYHPR